MGTAQQVLPASSPVYTPFFGSEATVKVCVELVTVKLHTDQPNTKTLELAMQTTSAPLPTTPAQCDNVCAPLPTTPAQCDSVSAPQLAHNTCATATRRPNPEYLRNLLFNEPLLPKPQPPHPEPLLE